MPGRPDRSVEVEIELLGAVREEDVGAWKEQEAGRQQQEEGHEHLRWVPCLYVRRGGAAVAALALVRMKNPPGRPGPDNSTQEVHHEAREMLRTVADKGRLHHRHRHGVESLLPVLGSSHLLHVHPAAGAGIAAAAAAAAASDDRAWAPNLLHVHPAVGGSDVGAACPWSLVGREHRDRDRHQRKEGAGTLSLPQVQECRPSSSSP